MRHPECSAIESIDEKKFLQLIKDRLGIHVLSHQTIDLKKTLMDACNKFHYRPDEYLKMLETCPEKSPLLEHLIERITIGETYFFRDKHQMQLLQEVILPNIIQSKRQEKNLNLRIWSAGCASGEEIYTIAMILKELLSDIHSWRLQLLGTDINATTLQKAINGIYTEWSMRSISDYFKKKYFSQSEKEYVLSPEIIELVNFSYLNLSDNTYPSLLNNTNNQDLIICRNVLIYFDNNEILDVMEKFNASLVPNGYLLLGASDPVSIKHTELINYNQEAVLFHRKMMPHITIEEPKKNNFTLPIRKTIPSSKVTPKTSTPGKKGLISQLIEEAKWKEILIAMDNYHEEKNLLPFFLGAKGIALANLGNLEKSIRLCEESLAIDPTNIQVRFTLAMSLIELNQTKQAERELRKCLFLNHQFVLAHFQLGMLLLKEKQYEAGLKSLKNALFIASIKEPTLSVPGFKNLDFGNLKKILEQEIEIHTTFPTTIKGQGYG